MKIFVSSLITGMEEYRAAVKSAIRALGHEAVMAEDFGAKPHSPQIACLEGLRQSGLVILLIGAGYGVPQASGLSATHEEYREAKGRIPVIAFAQSAVDREVAEKEFLNEVQGWESGLFRGSFDSPERLRELVTRAIHEWQVSIAASPLDTEALAKRATESLASQKRNRSSGDHTLLMSLISGPIQTILRPSEIEKDTLKNKLLQAALFGSHSIFSTAIGNKFAITGDSLHIEQDNNASLRLDPQGGLVFHLGVGDQPHGMVVIRENLERIMISSIRYAAWVLDEIDPTQRLTHTAIAVAFSDSNPMLIRTQAEQTASPNSFNMGGFGGWTREEKAILLTPPYRPRAALSHEAEALTEDFITLLKRQHSDRRY